MINVKFIDIVGALLKALSVVLLLLIPLLCLELNLSKIIEIILDTAVQIGFSLLGFSITALSMLSLLSSKDWFKELEEYKDLYPRIIDNFYVSICSFAIIATLGFIGKLFLASYIPSSLDQHTLGYYVLTIIAISVLLFLFAFSIFWLVELMQVLVKLLKATKE